MVMAPGINHVRGVIKAEPGGGIALGRIPAGAKSDEGSQQIQPSPDQPQLKRSDSVPACEHQLLHEPQQIRQVEQAEHDQGKRQKP